MQEVGKINILDVLEHGDRNKGNVSSCDRWDNGCIAAEVRWARVITEKIYNHSVHSCVCNSEMCVRVKSQGGKKVGESGDS